MAPQRGSDQLDPGHRPQLDTAKLSQITDLAAKSNFHILRWEIYGQPAIDWIRGTFRVPQGQVGEMVEKVLNGGISYNIEVFPIGIPKPDGALVNIQYGPR